jgi:ankyrin repeat protein
MSKPKEAGVLKTPPEVEMAIVVVKGDLGRVTELLDFGVDPNYADEERSFLYSAVRNGHHVIMTRLLKAGAKVQRTHLAASIRGGNPRCSDRILDELIYSGIEVDMSHEAGALLFEHGEAASSTPAMLTWLKQQGVDFVSPDRLGRTILEIAEIDGAKPDILEAIRGLMA